MLGSSLALRRWVPSLHKRFGLACSVKSRKPANHSRRLSVELLEERALLSVLPPQAATVWKDVFESDAVAPVGVGQKSVHLFDNSTATKPWVSDQFSPTPVGGTTDTRFGFDWCYHSNSSNDNVLVVLTGGGNNVVSYLTPTGVYNWNFSGQGQAFAQVAATATDVWYHTDMTIHPAIGQQVGYYDIDITRLLDNVQISSVENLPYLPPTSGFTSIWIEENQVNSQVGTDVYFDNFTVAAPPATNVYQHDFESDTYGAEPTGWGCYYTDANADFQVFRSDVVAPVGVGQKSVHLFDNSTATKPWVSDQFSPTPVGGTTDTRLGFDWCYHSNSSNDNVLVVLTGGGNNVVSYLTPTGVYNWNFSGQGQAFAQVAATATDVWYHTDMTIHPAIGQQVGYYDIDITRLLDNVQISSVENLPYLPPTSGFTSIWIEENQVNSQVGTDVYFDNFTVAGRPQRMSISTISSQTPTVQNRRAGAATIPMQTPISRSSRQNSRWDGTTRIPTPTPACRLPLRRPTWGWEPDAATFSTTAPPSPRRPTFSSVRRRGGHRGHVPELRLVLQRQRRQCCGQPQQRQLEQRNDRAHADRRL